MRARSCAVRFSAAFSTSASSAFLDAVDTLEGNYHHSRLGHVQVQLDKRGVPSHLYIVSLFIYVI